METYSVIAATPGLADAEAVFGTSSLREALLAVHALTLLTPLRLSVYLNGYLRILRVDDGRWLVPTSDLQQIRRTA